MHNHRWKLIAGILSLVFHHYCVVIGMDWYLPAGLHKKKRGKVISLQITAQLGIKRTLQIMGIFGIYSLKLTWLHLITWRVFKKKSDILRSQSQGCGRDESSPSSGTGSGRILLKTYHNAGKKEKISFAISKESSLALSFTNLGKVWINKIHIAHITVYILCIHFISIIEDMMLFLKTALCLSFYFRV